MIHPSLIFLKDLAWNLVFQSYTTKSCQANWILTQSHSNFSWSSKRSSCSQNWLFKKNRIWLRFIQPLFQVFFNMATFTLLEYTFPLIYRSEKSVVRDVTLWCCVRGSWHFKGKYCLHLYGSSSSIPSSWAAWPLKMKKLHSFETSGTTHPTQHHVPEDLPNQQHCCENPKFNML